MADSKNKKTSENKKEKQTAKPKKMKILIPKIKIEDAIKCYSTEQAYKIFRDILDYEKYELKDQEHFWIMGIDEKYFVSCIYIAAIGADNRAIIDPVDMFATAINHKSKVIVLAHNHPNTKHIIPSDADINLTNSLYHACKPFGLLILDHIIIADNNYLSLLRNGNMSEIFKMRDYKPYNEIKLELDAEKEEAVKTGIIEIVKNLLSMNMDIETIMKATGLSKKDILKIKKEMK